MFLKFFARRQARKVRDYIDNAPVPPTADLDPKAIILLPGGDAVRTSIVAASLYKQGVGKLFVPSGVGKNEAAIVKTLRDAGVPTEAILIEPDAVRTRDNGRFSARALGARKAEPCIIVKQRFHLLRCRLNYGYWGFRNLTLYPSDAPGTSMERADQEGVAYVNDWIQNRLDRWFN